MAAPSPAIRGFFVRHVDPIGRTMPTHFGARAYNWAYIFGSDTVRPRRIVPGRRLACPEIRA